MWAVNRVCKCEGPCAPRVPAAHLHGNVGGMCELCDVSLGPHIKRFNLTDAKRSEATPGPRGRARSAGPLVVPSRERATWAGRAAGPAA